MENEGTELRKVTEEKMCFEALIGNISSILSGDISTDSNINIISCENWDTYMEGKARDLLNAVSVLMEKADDETKSNVLIELGRY